MSRVREALTRPARWLLGRAGYDVVKRGQAWLAIPPDVDDAARQTIEAVQWHTLTTPERIFGLIEATRYVTRAAVPGAIVECGVWRGGSMMAVARTLVDLGETTRQLVMFDTFDRMPLPDDRDVDAAGRPAMAYFQGPTDPHDTDAFRYLPLDEVRGALESTGYPAARMRFVKGMVEDTVPSDAPDAIALLRLDTDWYRSTRHEMEHLFPRIVDGGVLIVDDYAHFQGARDAVDEVLAELDRTLLLTRMDWSGRMAVVRKSPT